jgi:hypothetical protein
MSGTEVSVDEGELRHNMLVFLSIQLRVHWFAHPIPPLAKAPAVCLRANAA